MIKKLRKIGADEVGTRGQDFRTCTTYDNFDFVEHKSDERLRDRKTQRSVTTVFQFQGIRLLEGGLQQNMWRPKHKVRV